MKLIKKLIVLTLMLVCGILCANVDINALLKSAYQGDAEAQFDLGWRYAYGYGVKQDDAEAVKWYRKAAEQGHAEAANNLDRF
jgi:TPR repeat protein